MQYKISSLFIRVFMMIDSIIRSNSLFEGKNSNILLFTNKVSIYLILNELDMHNQFGLKNEEDKTYFSKTIEEE